MYYYIHKCKSNVNVKVSTQKAIQRPSINPPYVGKITMKVVRIRSS